MNSKMLKDAKQLAYKYFKHKKDKGNNPYMQHLYFVSEHCSNENSKIVGILHDIMEDTNCSISELENILHNNLIESIYVLTKRKNGHYSDYISRIIKSNDMIAIEVKLHDLENNMDITRLRVLKESDKNRIYKYKKAYNRLWEVWNNNMEEYDYKKNIEKLIKRYENKIKVLYDNKYVSGNVGLAKGLEMVIYDLQDILDNIEV